MNCFINIFFNLCFVVCQKTTICFRSVAINFIRVGCVRKLHPNVFTFSRIIIRDVIAFIVRCIPRQTGDNDNICIVRVLIDNLLKLFILFRRKIENAAGGHKILGKSNFDNEVSIRKIQYFFDGFTRGRIYILALDFHLARQYQSFVIPQCRTCCFIILTSIIPKFEDLHFGVVDITNG